MLMMLLSSLLGTHKRRRRLKAEWYFECSCSRCVDPTECGTMVSAVTCEACEEGFLLPRDPLDCYSDWPCDACDFHLEVRRDLVDHVHCKHDDGASGARPGEEDVSALGGAELSLLKERSEEAGVVHRGYFWEGSAASTLYHANSKEEL